MLSKEDAIELAQQLGVDLGDEMILFDEDDRSADERQAEGEPLGWAVKHNSDDTWSAEPMLGEDAPG